MIELKAARALNIKVSSALQLVKLADENGLAPTWKLDSCELLLVVFLESWTELVDDIWRLDDECLDVSDDIGQLEYLLARLIYRT